MTWIVDARNRPGTHFTDLPPAIQAASSGDVIVVCGNAYYHATATTNKGLTIRGEEDPTQPGLPMLSGLLQIDGLAATASFVLQGFESQYWFPGLELSLQVRNSAGRVHIDAVGVTGFAFLNVTACPFVSSTRSRLMQVVTVDSEILSRDCEVRGASYQQLSGLFSGTIFPSAAIAATRSRITVVSGRVEGGWASAPCWLGYVSFYPGIIATDATVVVSGQGTVVAGGQTPSTWACQGSMADAYWGTRGTLTYDPAIQIGAITGSSVVVRTAVPWLLSSAASPGGTIQIDVAAPAGTTVASFVSLGTVPLATVYGPLWLDPRYMVLIDVTVMNASGTYSRVHPVLSLYPMGLPLAFQAGVWDGTAVSLTTPSVTVLR